jgi:hypothetical protein
VQGDSFSAVLSPVTAVTSSSNSEPASSQLFAGIGMMGEVSNESLEWLAAVPLCVSSPIQPRVVSPSLIPVPCTEPCAASPTITEPSPPSVPTISPSVIEPVPVREVCALCNRPGAYSCVSRLPRMLPLKHQSLHSREFADELLSNPAGIVFIPGMLKSIASGSLLVEPPSARAGQWLVSRHLRYLSRRALCCLRTLTCFVICLYQLRFRSSLIRSLMRLAAITRMC